MPVAVDLLDPNFRSVQITTNLSRFWKKDADHVSDEDLPQTNVRNILDTTVYVPEGVEVRYRIWSAPPEA